MRVTVPWTPHAKQRPRVTKQGVAYTTKATRDAEAAFVDGWRTECGAAPLDCPLEMHVEFTNTDVTVTLNSCDDYENRKLRGDIDNYLKLVMDSLNGIAYVDDKQIVKVTAWKA